MRTPYPSDNGLEWRATTVPNNYIDKKDEGIQGSRIVYGTVIVNGSFTHILN